MTVEVMLNTPLAEALTTSIQPKLNELGWGSGAADDSALAEYIVLMLVNGKTQEEIASELSGEFLNLGPDDPGARDFTKWLFEQIDTLNAQQNGASATAAGDSAMTDGPQNDTTMGGDQDMEMAATDNAGAELNAYVPLPLLRSFFSSFGHVYLTSFLVRLAPSLCEPATFEVDARSA